MFMRATAVLLGFLIYSFAISTPADASPAKDGWSERIRGLRARLVLGEGRIFNGTRFLEVYLELHNGSDMGQPMEFDFSASKSIRFDLRTSDGKPAPIKRNASVDGYVFGPFRITLPRDGTLRFPVTWRGHGIPRNGGTGLEFEGPNFGGFWLIPDNDPNDYFLSAVFEVPETRPADLVRWQGTLRIPAVKVPAKAAATTATPK